MSQTYKNCIKCRLLIEPPKFIIQPPPDLPIEYLNQIISNNNLTQKLGKLKCLLKKQQQQQQQQHDIVNENDLADTIFKSTITTTDNLSITNLFIFIICAILFILIFLLLTILIIKYFRSKLIRMRHHISNSKNNTILSSNSSELSNTDTNDTNLLDIIQTTKKFYLNPILQQQQHQQHVTVNLPFEGEEQQQQEYNYYQREYEEINEINCLNTLSLKRQCLSCHNHHHFQQQQSGFNYSSSSTSSTSSTSKLIRNSKTVNNFDCITCGKNLLIYPVLPSQQQHQILSLNSRNSAFKPILTHQINEIQTTAKQPASYLYYAC